jgi:hypothetical protein
MSIRVAIRLAGITLGMALAAPAAVAYIHFPPMTLQKMCKVSHQIRVLKVEKLNKEKGIIIFEVADSPKSQKPQVTPFKHVLSTDVEGTKPILDWAEEGKTAVMFSIESQELGIGYVFIDDHCYSVDYNRAGKYWLLIRAEPGMSACYHGSVERLRAIIKDILDGKEVMVPVKEPETKVDGDQRRKEVNDVLKKNR